MRGLFALLTENELSLAKVRYQNFEMDQKILNLTALSERLAATRIGQYVISKAERALLVVEQTAAWGIPQKQKKDAQPPKRPLPWIPFFTLIVLLRMSRASLTLLAILMNKSSVTPEKTVHYLQERRRALRAVRRRAQKDLANKEEATSSHNDAESNAVTQNNVKSKRKSSGRPLPCNTLLDKHAAEGSDADDDDYIYGSDESSLEDEELSEVENSNRHISKTNNESEADQHSKTELHNKSYDDEDTLSATEGPSDENTDTSRLDSTTSPPRPENNHVSSLQVKLSNSRPEEPPKEPEKSPNEPVDPELLVQKLSKELHKMEIAQNKMDNMNDTDANIDPDLLVAGINLLLAHNGGNLDDLSKHFNDILNTKATPDVERTLENHHPFERDVVRESQDLIHSEKNSSRVDLNNRNQTPNKPDKVIRSGYQNPKRSKGATPRRTK